MTISSVPNHSPSLFLSLPLPLSPSPSSFRQRETVKGKGEWVCQMYPHVLYRWDHVIRFLWLCCFSQSPLRRGEGSQKYLRHQKIFPWGSKHKYLITSKNIPQSLVFYGFCNSLCRTLDLDIEHSQGSTLRFDSTCNTLEFDFFDVRWFLWNLRWFKICLCLV